jgi:hypothetical protein
MTISTVTAGTKFQLLFFSLMFLKETFRDELNGIVYQKGECLLNKNCVVKFQEPVHK